MKGITNTYSLYGWDSVQFPQYYPPLYLGPFLKESLYVYYRDDAG